MLGLYSELGILIMLKAEFSKSSSYRNLCVNRYQKNDIKISIKQLKYSASAG